MCMCTCASSFFNYLNVESKFRTEERSEFSRVLFRLFHDDSIVKDVAVSDINSPMRRIRLYRGKTLLERRQDYENR